MVSEAEFARLVVALIVLPLVWRLSRGVRMDTRSKPAYVVLLSAVYIAYILTIVEGFVFPDAINAVQHLLYGVGGVAAVAVAWIVRTTVIRESQS